MFKIVKTSSDVFTLFTRLIKNAIVSDYKIATLLKYMYFKLLIIRQYANKPYI